MRKVMAVTLAAAALFAVSAAGAQEHKIGAVFPLSGPNADYGEQFQSGTKLAVEHINADKILKGKLEILYEDSQALPQQGVVAMNKLVNVSKVPYSMAAFTSVSKAVAPIGERAKVVSVNGGGVGPDLAELGPYFWNVIPLANFEVKAIVPNLVKKGMKRFVLVFVDDPLGEAIKKELTTLVPAEGGTLVESLQIPRAAQQFSGIAAKVRDAKPDVVYIASFGAQQGQIIKQLRDNGVSQQLVSYSGFSTKSVLELPEAKGVLFTSQKVDWNASDPVTQRFVKDYEAANKKKPNQYVANYYNAVLVYALLAASLEKKGKPVTGENLLAERKEMKKFTVVGGAIEFLDNGTVSAPMQINEIDGKGGTTIVQ